MLQARAKRMVSYMRTRLSDAQGGASLMLKNGISLLQRFIPDQITKRHRGTAGQRAGPWVAFL